MPASRVITAWDLMTRDVDIGALLTRLDCPLLFAKHEGCLMSTEEGFDDAAAAFPQARTVSTIEAPLSSEKFADAVRAFCEDVLNGVGENRAGRGAEI
jgi:hypothetical protein